MKFRLTIIFSIILFAGVGCVTRTQDISDAPQPEIRAEALTDNLPGKTENLNVDTTKWIFYDHQREGVTNKILSNFKYPDNWITYNFAGGRNVAIYFSDGGTLRKQPLTAAEIKQHLQYADFESVGDECRLYIFYNGERDTKSIYTLNTKKDENESILCNNLLQFMGKQVL